VDVVVGTEESNTVFVSEIEARIDVVNSSKFDVVEDVGKLAKIVDGSINEADADTEVSFDIDEGVISRE